MATIKEKQAQIVKEFSALEDWEDRYKHIIQVGREMPKLDESKKLDENLLKGCQSKVWLIAHLDGDKVIFEAESDAAIVQGLVSLLVRTYSGHTPQDILETPPVFIDELGLRANLSQTRANGLASMVKQVKFYAIAFQAALSS